MNKDLDYTDWLTLETAIETIGDMIAYQCARLYKALELDPLDIALIDEIKTEIKRLSEERQLCYDKNKNQEVMMTAYTAYGPYLRMINNCRR